MSLVAFYGMLKPPFYVATLCDRGSRECSGYSNAGNNTERGKIMKLMFEIRGEGIKIMNVCMIMSRVIPVVKVLCASCS